MIDPPEDPAGMVDMPPQPLRGGHLTADEMQPEPEYEATGDSSRPPDGMPQQPEPELEAPAADGFPKSAEEALETVTSGEILDGDANPQAQGEPDPEPGPDSDPDPDPEPEPKVEIAGVPARGNRVSALPNDGAEQEQEPATQQAEATTDANDEQQLEEEEEREQQDDDDGGGAETGSASEEEGGPNVSLATKDPRLLAEQEKGKADKQMANGTLLNVVSHGEGVCVGFKAAWVGAATHHGASVAPIPAVL